MDLKDYAHQVFHRTLNAIDIAATLRTNLIRHGDRLSIGDETLDLRSFDAVLLVALGKAAVAMSHTTLEVLDGIPLRGLVVSGEVIAERDARLSYRTGGHPVPTSASRAAAEAILDLLTSASEQTLVLFLISGGASAMSELPLQRSISVQDTAAFYQALLHSGLPITEMNCIRKHFSAVKGGRLAKAAEPATQITLLVSDVPGNLLDVVASGPTLPDPSTTEECRQILSREGLLRKLPSSVASFFSNPQLPDTVKANDRCFARSEVRCILSEENLLEQAATIAASDGFQVTVDRTCDDWPNEDAANYLLDRIANLRTQGGRHCLVSGGEISVRLPEQVGIGGRNQHFALTCARALHHSRAKVTVLSAGSDGLDGNSPAAGAVIDNHTWAEAQHRGLDPEQHLQRFNSFPLFEAIGASIVSGPTGNNLRDLRLLLVED